MLPLQKQAVRHIEIKGVLVWESGGPWKRMKEYVSMRSGGASGGEKSNVGEGRRGYQRVSETHVVEGQGVHQTHFSRVSILHFSNS